MTGEDVNLMKSHDTKHHPLLPSTVHTAMAFNYRDNPNH